LKKNNILSVFCSFILLLSNYSFAAATTSSEKSDNQRFVYEVYYKNISIGEMIQQYHKKPNGMDVESLANFSFLFYSFGGSQQSDIYWDEKHKLFLNRSFSRKNVGFGTTEMSAHFDNINYSTQVISNGVESEYNNPKAPITGFNTINLQISEGIKAGKRDFEFYMQTSDDISHYFFQVTGTETIKTNFGDLKTYRVEQIKKSDRTFIAWYAPELGHQMVKFHYKRRVLDISGELITHES
jgi:hypothetical protein